MFPGKQQYEFEVKMKSSQSDKSSDCISWTLWSVFLKDSLKLNLGNSGVLFLNSSQRMLGQLFIGESLLTLSNTILTGRNIFIILELILKTSGLKFADSKLQISILHLTRLNSHYDAIDLDQDILDIFSIHLGTLWGL